MGYRGKMLKRIARWLLVERPLSRDRDLNSISDTSSLGLRFRIKHSVPPQRREYVSIGERCYLNCQIIFESEQGHVSIGDNVEVGNSQIICHDSVRIEDNVTIAWGVTIYDHDSHSLDYEERRRDHSRLIQDASEGSRLLNKDWTTVKSEPIVVKKDAWIGMNAIILKGVRIGERAVVGAGSVVTKDVPDDCVVAGNPAKAIKVLS